MKVKKCPRCGCKIEEVFYSDDENHGIYIICRRCNWGLSKIVLYHINKLGNFINHEPPFDGRIGKNSA